MTSFLTGKATSRCATALTIAALASVSARPCEARHAPLPQEVEQWVIFDKRANSLLRPLEAAAPAAEQRWTATRGYQAGLYDSLLSYTEHLAGFSYDAHAFRVLTDSMMADEFTLEGEDVPRFITAFFEVARKVPSHNQRLQNLIVWFNHPAFATYHAAIKLRLYRLYAQRGRLDLYPGKPLDLLTRAKTEPSDHPLPFARSSRTIREQVTADLLSQKPTLWGKKAFCQSLQSTLSSEACVSLALIASLKAKRLKWINTFHAQRVHALGNRAAGAVAGLSPELAIKVIHWLAFREQYAKALAEFDAMNETPSLLPLSVKQLQLFLLLKTKAYERFDHEAEAMTQRLGEDAAAWRRQLAGITTFDQLKAHNGALFATGLKDYAFDPLLSWHERLGQWQQTTTELSAFGANLLRFSAWQRLQRPSHQGLKRDSDMQVTSALLDDMSEAIVRGTLAELSRYRTRLKPADRLAVLQACKLIIEQDSQFSRYHDAAKVLAHSSAFNQSVSIAPKVRWQRTWQGYLNATSEAALAQPQLAASLPGSERGFLSAALLTDVQLSQQLVAQQHDFERRGILWQQILTRQRAIAHHSSRIQLVLETYRDTIAPTLDSSYYGHEQLWHRIGAVLTKAYKRTKVAIAEEHRRFDRQQQYLLDQAASLSRWQGELRQQEAKLWQAFTAAKPNLLSQFDTMIARQQKLLEKWQADRLSGRYLEVAGQPERQGHSADKLETLSSSLKTLKMATWLEWPLITRQ